ncbi:pom152p [Saccharomyces arboricola H-6]|uniref:Pom152p n=1 Tax=Saccharomyces arboricola (strain H-6 / AS 2.3317 / CBS 10644) TaxID=1160507 RepID=J8LQ58_SACAR|nr:pom152p [Saccharomyces arboricola H-6]
MEHRYNVFNDTPRGNHWMGSSSSRASHQSHSDRSSANTTRRFQYNGDESSEKIRPLSSRKLKNSESNDLRDEKSRIFECDSKDRYFSDDKKVNLNSLPLISTDVLEISKQRTFAVILFLLIQCYKIYDLVILKSGLPLPGLLFKNYRFNFISKYFIIESLYLYVLPSFNIPRLAFKPWMVYVQILTITALNIFLSSDHEFVLISLIMTTWRKFHTKELSVTGSSINHHRISDSSAHFKGALTIKILPENTAMFNPLHESYCLPMDTSLFEVNSIDVPIRINSTEEIDFIELEYRDLYTNTVEHRSLTKKDFKVINNPKDLLKKETSTPKTHTNDFEEDSTIRYLSLTLQDVGFYQIKKIVDSKRLNLKIHQSHLVVPYCPIASITGTGNNNRCIGDSDNVSIEIQGVPPMKLVYSKIVNGQKFSYVDSSLQPEYFESPLQSSKPRQSFTIDELNDLKWGRNQPVNINLDSSITQDGKYAYKIDKLVDGLGNVMDFTSLSEDLRNRHGLSYDFNVHGIPRAALEERFDSKSPTKRSIAIVLEGTKNWASDIPYVISLSYADAQDNSKKEMNITTNSLTKVFQADLPGTYNLEYVESKFCPGVIVGKSNVLVTMPVPPTMEVKSFPILDQCVGQVGLNFELSFTGAPPYYYNSKIYKIEHGERKLYDAKRYTSEGTRNHFSYSPSKEGNYEIVFDNVSNKLFTEPIKLEPVEDYTFKTSMRVKPSAALKLHHDLKLCLGDHSSIPVSLKGQGPFTLTYDIIETFSSKRRTFEIKDIKTNEYIIKTPDFTTGGDYILSLVSIKDSSGCLVGLSQPDSKIKVRRDIPSATFNFFEPIKEVKIKHGSVTEIPLKLSGEGPFTVKYKHMDYNGNVLEELENKFQDSYIPALKVTKEGLYQLVDMRDSSCQGKVTNENVYKVSFLKRPSFTIQDNHHVTRLTSNLFAKEEVCQGMEGTIDLALFGSPPFILEYDLMAPTGHISSKKIQVTTKYASLKLPNQVSGEYVATIKAIYDGNYGETDTHFEEHQSEVVVKQTVHPIPDVVFSDGGKTLRACAANVDQISFLEPIDLKFLQGESPFSITFSVYHESTSRTDQYTIDNIDLESFSFEKLYEGMKLGNHAISIDSVIDANGCVNNVVSGPRNQILVSITDAPKIHILDSSTEYCVGDYVAYQLNGVAPFMIKYEFNGVPLKSKERSSQFVRLASEPGIISINSLQDSSSQCIVDFTKPGLKNEFNDLTLNIHPIPSVTVSQGNYITEDIREGDQAEVIFSFEGTPPFSLTYVRTEETDRKHGKKRSQVVETHKVTDIYSSEYKVVTSLQGTYEAIEITDAYCFAKNDLFFNN